MASLLGTVLTRGAEGASLGTSVNAGWGTLIGGVVGAGEGLVEGLLTGNAEKDAAKKQVSAARKAQAVVDQYYGIATQQLQPYAAAGTTGLNALESGIRSGSFNMPNETFNAPAPYQTPEFNFQADPGYAFRLSQGTTAVQNSAAAQGSGLSAATQKALARYGQNLASQEYGNAYNRYSNDRDFGLGAYQKNYGNQYQNFVDQYQRQALEKQGEYNRAYGLAGIGSNAAGNLASLATGQGATQANILGQIGNVQASGVLGQANSQREMTTNALNTIPYMVQGIKNQFGGGSVSDMVSGAGSSVPTQNPYVNPNTSGDYPGQGQDLASLYRNNQKLNAYLVGNA